MKKYLFWLGVFGVVDDFFLELQNRAEYCPITNAYRESAASMMTSALYSQSASELGGREYPACIIPEYEFVEWERE